MKKKIKIEEVDFHEDDERYTTEDYQRVLDPDYDAHVEEIYQRRMNALKKAKESQNA